jgi:hypothetical protein
VRARSAAIVRRQVALVLLGKPEIADAWRSDILEHALDAAVVRAIEVVRTRGAPLLPQRRAA